MNDLRNEILDSVIELVFCSFPGLTDGEFRCFVSRVLRIIDHAVAETMAIERHRRYWKAYLRSKN